MTGAAQIDVWTPKSESYCSRDAEEKKKGNDTLWKSLCGHRRAKANAEETQIKKKKVDVMTGYVNHYRQI